MILAAGYGKRMKPLSLNKPKPLFDFRKKKLLEYSIEILHKLNISDIVVNTHYLHEQIESFINNKKWKLKISHEKKILDTGGGILKTLNFFDNKSFLVLNSDTIWTESYVRDIMKLYDTYKKNNSKACLLLAKIENSFDSNLLGDFYTYKTL